MIEHRPSVVHMEDGSSETFAHVKVLDSGCLYCLERSGGVSYYSPLAWHQVERSGESDGPSPRKASERRSEGVEVIEGP